MNLKIFHKNRMFNLLYRFYYENLKILQWIFNFRFISKKNTKRSIDRILLLYNLKFQPFSVGDLLLMQLASLILLSQKKVKHIDLAIIYDAENPTPSDKSFSSIDKNNFLYSVPAFLLTAQVNLYLGSFHIFNNESDADKYIHDNLDYAYTWPTGFNYAVTQSYLYYKIFDDLIYPFYKDNGFIPELKNNNFFENWAHNFFKINCSGKIPITVNIRNNPIFDLDRNSDLSTWISFFKNCSEEFPSAFFIIICSVSEVDERLRRLPNILIAKDFGTQMQEELSLIQCSAIHMGASSGPATIAWFGKKPYLIVKTTLQDQVFKHKDIVIKDDDESMRFIFANRFQKFITGNETVEKLTNEFRLMFNKDSILEWEKTHQDSSDQANLNTWLK